MTLSLMYGSAFETTDDGPGNWREYSADGRYFIGSDTDDIAHACSWACARELLPPDIHACANDPSAYITLRPFTYTDGRPTDEYPTIDIVDFDPGDDPYVLCEACGAVLVDERITDDSTPNDTEANQR